MSAAKSEYVHQRPTSQLSPGSYGIRKLPKTAPCAFCLQKNMTNMASVVKLKTCSLSLTDSLNLYMD